MILERDAFTIEYDAAQTSLDDMYTAITDLGYTPRLAPNDAQDGASIQSASGPPALVAAAIAKAAADNKLVFVDFFAEWCIACKALEQKTLEQAQVRDALQEFIVLKIDTDLNPDAALYYEIVGMPTLLVLDSEGQEVFRSVGPITAPQLSEKLQQLVALAD